MVTHGHVHVAPKPKVKDASASKEQRRDSKAKESQDKRDAGGVGLPAGKKVPKAVTGAEAKQKTTKSTSSNESTKRFGDTDTVHMATSPNSKAKQSKEMEKGESPVRTPSPKKGSTSPSKNASAKASPKAAARSPSPTATPSAKKTPDPRATKSPLDTAMSEDEDIAIALKYASPDKIPASSGKKNMVDVSNYSSPASSLSPGKMSLTSSPGKSSPNKHSRDTTMSSPGKQ